MATLVNYIECTAGARKGTGVLGCKIPTGIPDGFIAVSKTWEFDPETEDFDEAYQKLQVQKGLWHPFNNAVDFTENNEETQLKTYNTGIKLPTREGLPELEFVYSNGYSWHSAVYSFNGYGNYNIILVWKNNVIGTATKPDGKLTGLSAGYLNVKPFKNSNGSDPAETMIAFQLIDGYQYNSQMSLIDGSVNGFNVSNLKGSLDAKITVPTVPSDTDTSISVKVVTEFNPAIDVRGLTVDDFKITGKTVSAAVYNTATELYDLTTDAFSTADVFKVSLNDGTYDIVETATGAQYKGESKSYTV